MLTSYLGPFVATFFIAMFILLMQFLWKYIDDLVGKGLEWYIIGELLFYASATFVPLALPLAVLLSSIMTMGAMGEHYELVAFKSAGISLNKIMWPMVLISSFLMFSAFFFSNNVLPVANLKSISLLYDVRHHRPAFNIAEGVYYKGIDNFVIKVEKKESDGQVLRDIKIYDHSERKGNVNLTTAEWGTMAVTPDKRHMILTLYNGINYQENAEDQNDHSRPFQRTLFERQVRKFDLSSFDLTRTDEEYFKSSFQMLNLNQLKYFVDSVGTELQIRKDNLEQMYWNRFHFLDRIDSAHYAGISKEAFIPWNTDSVDLFVHDQRAVISRAMNAVRQNKEQTEYSHEEFRHRQRYLARYQIEFHRKFTLSVACIVFFLIGAPMGAIIRKGGFGLPMVISVLFFVVFHVISIMGEKFVREGVLPAHQGMWIAPLILLPVGILLTIKATTDSSLLDTDSYIKPFEKIAQRFFKSR